jgi:hypothetical protein
LNGERSTYSKQHNDTIAKWSLAQSYRHMLQLDIALRYRVHKLQLQTWGFPEVGPWHILSHSFASSESALFPGKKNQT